MPEEDFYHNCHYGDDSEISFEDLNRIKEIVTKERVFFKWKRGDLLILDNLISMHGRNSFSGPRRILVAMS
jgi:alpha-ketoglutarate-dependent taurine dioxygenase